ncbi:hypothetical protein AAC387_Pa01g0366 [Persea americana]
MEGHQPTPPAYFLPSDSNSNPPRRTTSDFFVVYVSAEWIRFIISTRFLSLPIFVALLNKANKELGFQA